MSQKVVWKSSGKAEDGVGPAEPAEAAYSRFARNQISDFWSVPSTRLSAGAGRIQSLRAFRRARTMKNHEKSEFWTFSKIFKNY